MGLACAKCYALLVLSKLETHETNGNYKLTTESSQFFQLSENNPYVSRAELAAAKPGQLLNATENHQDAH